MKKILTTAAIAAMLTANTAFADYADGFYGRVNAGASMFMSEKAKLSASGLDLKYKEATSGFAGVGAGYYAHDMVRADVMFDYYFSPELKQKGLVNNGNTYNGKFKADLYTLMTNAYVSPVEFEGFKPYLSVGLGVAFVKGKLTVNDTKNSLADVDFKSKQETNFAWSVGAGVGYEVSHGMHAELFYKYSDFGESKPGAKLRDNDNVVENNKFHLRSHNAGLGLRIDM